MSDEIRNEGATPSGISRRDVLKRGAIIGGALWAAPTIQSLTNAASAQTGSPVIIKHICCICRNHPTRTPADVVESCNGETDTIQDEADCVEVCGGQGFPEYEYCEFTGPGTPQFDCSVNNPDGEGCEAPEEADPTCSGLQSTGA